MHIRCETDSLNNEKALCELSTVWCDRLCAPGVQPGSAWNEVYSSRYFLFITSMIVPPWHFLRVPPNRV